MTDDEIADAALAGMDPNAGNIRRALLDAIKRTRADSAAVATDQAKRYTCRKMKGVCRAIADQIERASNEQRQET